MKLIGDNNMKIKSTVFSIILLLSQVTFAQSWYEQDIWQNEDRAFQWYPDPQEKARKQNEQQKQNVKAPELQAFEQFQKELDESRKIAIMNPTPDNIMRYVALQELAMTQAATFTDQWQRTIWENPSLDYSLQGRPTNASAIREYDNQRTQDTVRAIQQIAGANGIMFFYRSDCSYCHAMAPILRNFSNQYGIKIMAVSLDGGPMDGFPDAQLDNGISAKLGVTTVPAMYVMDTKSKTFKPIAFGVISQSDLESRFLTVVTEPGTRY